VAIVENTELASAVKNAGTQREEIPRTGLAALQRLNFDPHKVDLVPQEGKVLTDLGGEVGTLVWSGAKR
jgi:hypothetical protein